MSQTEKLVSTSGDVRVAKHQDIRRMTEILFDGLRGTKFFHIIYPDVDREHWIDVLADYCAQHVGDPHSIALVSEDTIGTITGMVYGRIFSDDVPGAKRRPLDGINQAEQNKMGNSTFKNKLITKYGSILCKSVSKPQI